MFDNRIKMYDILKLNIKDIADADFKYKLSKEEEKEYIISQQDTPLFRQLSLVRDYDTKRIHELIYVEAKHNKKKEDRLRKLLKDGFEYNNTKYVRFGKSSSMAKDGITVFIDENIYDEMMERSKLGVDVGKTVISKYESYRNLILSSCQFVDEKRLPYIVIVDEYETKIHNQHVRYAVKKDIEVIDEVTKQKRTFKNVRAIEEDKTDINISPFDGFGVHTKEISKVFNKYISNKHDSVLHQIRLPFLKGVSVEVDFRKFFRDNNVSKIKDVFGKWHDVNKIDCIWNTSMWKGYKYFKEAFGNKGWNEYLKRVKKYKYKIGISKYSHHTDEIDLYSRLNFQYLQCLDLDNPKYIKKFKDKDMEYDILDKKNWGKIINLAQYTTNLYEKIIKGDKLYTLKFLGINDSDEYSVESKYIEAVLINDDMLKDPSIKKMLKRKLDKAITQMKYGKIYASGFYHTVVGDIKGYLEYCAGLEPKGCLNANEFYTKTMPKGYCLSMRSPLVDPSEVNKIKIVENEFTKEYLDHFKNQDVCMINMHDISMQQQGGMDMDGDTVFLTDDEILVNSKKDVPIVVDMEDKKSSKKVEYNTENIIDYECNSRDNRIGEITNIATSILNQAPTSKKWEKINADNVSLLRLYQGKEIDFIKTGFRWIITKNLRKYLKKFPYFLLYNYPKKLKVYNKIRELNKDLDKEDKIPYNAFKSPSPMNELCDYVCKWEKKNIIWDRKVKNNKDLLINKDLPLPDRDTVRAIRNVYNEFNDKFREMITDDNNEKKNKEKIKKLSNEYHNKLKKFCLDDDTLSNYCIYAAYKSISTDKTLCWILYGEKMLSNLKDNTKNHKRYVIVKTDRSDPEGKNFLGKYYKLIEKDR